MKTRRHVKRIPSRDSLANAALYYLSRYAASEASLRRVLQNKLRRAAMTNPDFAQDAVRMAALQQDVEDIVAHHKKSGAINDDSFAEMKASSLRRAGRSRRFIQQSLAQKTGVSVAAIHKALAQVDGDENSAEAELTAAVSFAKRRRLGRFRTAGAADDDRLRKDLAAMARVGFSLDTARKALGSSGSIDDD